MSHAEPAPDSLPPDAERPGRLRWLFTPLRARVVARYLAAICAVLAGVLLWKLTPLTAPRVVLPDRCDILALSPDGGILVIRQERAVRLWNLRSGSWAAALPVQVAHRSDLTFSDDGAWLATHDAGVVNVWAMPAATEQLAVRVSDRKGFAPQLAFSPVSALLAFTAETDGETLLKLWDVARDREQGVFPARRIGPLRFSPDGSILAFETWRPTPKQPPKGEINLWNLGTGEKSVLDEEPRPPRLLAFSRDGRKLAAAERPRFAWDGDHEVTLWDLGAREVRGAWKVPHGVERLHFAFDGESLLVQSSINRPPETRFDMMTVLSEAAPRTSVSSVAHRVSPDGRLLARITNDDQHPSAIFDAVAMVERARLAPLPSKQRLSPLNFSPDGKWFALLGEKQIAPPADWLEAWLRKWLPRDSANAELHLYDAKTGQHHGAVPVDGHTESWFTSDGAMLAALGPERAPTVWDLPLRRQWGKLIACWLLLGFATLTAAVWLNRREQNPKSQSA